MKNNFGQSVGKGRLLIGVGLILLITGFLASIIWFLLRPCLYITSDKHVFYNQPVTTGKPFSTQFIHSVQKTPVLENFVVDVEHKEIILDSTKYKSFAVGLPFLKSDGAFQQAAARRRARGARLRCAAAAIGFARRYLL